MSDDTGTLSGRFLIRMEPALHAVLRREADRLRLSLNEYCVRRLAAGSAGAESSLSEAALSSLSWFGESVVGVAAFGSVARGEAVEGSDLDLLMVVEERIPITRELYERWDREARLSEPVEPHFVHLPPEGADVNGFWAEVALDGIVLFERGLVLSRRLGAIRRSIAEGRLVRKRMHGQAYWTDAA